MLPSKTLWSILHQLRKKVITIGWFNFPTSHVGSSIHEQPTPTTRAAMIRPPSVCIGEMANVFFSLLIDYVHVVLSTNPSAYAEESGQCEMLSI